MSMVQCEICGEEQADWLEVYHHRKAHDREKMHPCPYCERKFIQRANLVDHMKKHEEKKMRQQAKMEAQAKEAEIQAEGQPQIGPMGKLMVKCEICGKELANRVKLYRHRKMHNGERPHSCPYCDYKFNMRFIMEQHIKWQHKKAHMEAPDGERVSDGVQI